jgi:UDP-glucose 4-epimerase
MAGLTILEVTMITVRERPRRPGDPARLVADATRAKSSSAIERQIFLRNTTRSNSWD